MSDYLIFPALCQAVFIVPASIILWVVTMHNLPKKKDGRYSVRKASKKYYKICVPYAVAYSVGFSVLGILKGYGNTSALQGSIEMIFLAVVPAVCNFYIMRFFHERVVIKNMRMPIAMILNIIASVAVVAVTVVVCIGIIEPTIESFV